MIRSMTAFARRERQGEWGKLVWELRSVNHRYLDVHPRLPDELRFLETALRERVAARLQRGKIECTLKYRSAPGVAGGVQVNWTYAEQLLAASRELGSRMEQTAALSPLELLRTPGVMQEAEPDLAPLSEAALALLDETLEELISARDREGARLHAIVLDRVRSVEALTHQVRERRGEVNRQIRERLLARLEEANVASDPARLEQELVFVAQRLDVDEELERLLAHAAEVQSSVDQSEPVGRRLDFLMQELNREANTLSSKSQDAPTTQAAVEMKVLIEQMREQIQNVE